MIIPANEDRVTVNDILRRHFQQQGKIDKDAFETKILVNKGLSLAQMRRVQNYKLDDVVRFNRDHEKLGVEKGLYAKIIDIDKKKNILILVVKGKKIEWEAHRFLSRTRGAIEVFEEEKRNLAKGDTLVWTRNNKKDGYINSEKIDVLAIKDHYATLRLGDGSIIEIDTKEPKNQHFDYAYAMTAYAAQGQSLDYVIAHDESFRKKLTNQKAFYVMVSRAVYGVTFYVDDKEDYINQLLNTTGEKTSSLEALQETKPPPQPQPKEEVKPYYDLNQLQKSLMEDTSSMVETLLGKPNAKLSNRVTWRYGKKGSLVVTTEGAKKGCWHNFETSEGGSLLQLIQKERGVSFYEACQFAAAWTHFEHKEATPSPPQYDKTKANEPDALD